MWFKRKRKTSGNDAALAILITVIVAILLFTFYLGSKKDKEEKKDKKEEKDKDLTKEVTNPQLPDESELEKPIIDLDARIVLLKAEAIERTNLANKVQRIVNRQIMGIKIFLVCALILFHTLCIIISGFDLSQFVLWNEAFFFGTLFMLFLISEKYSSVQNGFIALKEFINYRVAKRTNVNYDEIEHLNHVIGVLEFIRDTHPSFITN